jgi:ribosomal protein S18 acetylase RimI-like enzyme
VATIWEAGWRDGHLGHVPDALVVARTSRSFRERADERIPDTVVCDRLDDQLSQVVGFVTLIQDEVEQVYVAAEHRGSGAAGLLLLEGERLIASDGHQRAWLAVVAGNSRARRFYERQAWIDDGPFDYPTRAGDQTVYVPCHRYVKHLAAA